MHGGRKARTGQGRPCGTLRVRAGSRFLACVTGNNRKSACELCQENEDYLLWDHIRSSMPTGEFLGHGRTRNRAVPQKNRGVYGRLPAGRQHYRSGLAAEVMNMVGKEGRLGESIRCVMSVAMLTEGGDANNATHIFLGVRAFGTQLLCEQVVGRALRRQSYDLNENGLLDVEYVDVLDIPYQFHCQAHRGQTPTAMSHDNGPGRYTGSGSSGNPFPACFRISRGTAYRSSFGPIHP